MSAAALVAGATVVTACGSDDDNSQSGSSTTSTKVESATPIPDGPIVIGSATARTGPFAPYDAGTSTGLEVAVKDINDAGGVLGHQLKIKYADTQSDPAKGAAAATKLLGDGADIIVISSDFDLGGPAATTAIAKDKLAVAIAGSSDRFNPDTLGPLLFSMATASKAEGAIMARWGHDRKKARSAYLLLDPGFAYTKDLCEGFRSTFSELEGTEIVGDDTFESSDAKISAQIARIKEADPDVIYLCALVPAAPTVIKQIRAAGIDTPILAGAGVDGNYWIKAVPDLSNLYYDTYGSIFGDDSRPEVNEFVEKETELLGHPPATGFDLTGYATGQALKIAIERAKSVDGPALSKALESLKNEELLTGPTTFTSTSHLNGERPMAIMEVQGGKFGFIETYPEAE